MARIRTEREIVADQRSYARPAELLNPNTAGWAAMTQATDIGLDAARVSATITETVLRTVWDNARHLYDSADITHAHSIGEDNGGCNACILEDIARMLGRPQWASEIHANANP